MTLPIKSETVNRAVVRNSTRNLESISWVDILAAGVLSMVIAVKRNREEGIGTREKGVAVRTDSREPKSRSQEIFLHRQLIRGTGRGIRAGYQQNPIPKYRWTAMSKWSI
jgi:hypothetical protein